LKIQIFNKTFVLSKGQIFIYLMLSVQMIAWAIHQAKAGQLTDKPYLYFCSGMMIGQIGAAIECWRENARGTMILQIYFFFWTLWGFIVRALQMN
jgi:hypothetical protein